ncbi:MAG: heat-inducible transcriptional repressor HrcA [Candidatus Omnitrophica bacterium]|nr:heat-inducible transcriptional repressor HrcA [Candidatus Omnitrophota bacterium]
MVKEKIRDKNERKQAVLEHIIDTYVRTAVPVSSKMVSELMGTNLSSATIRNIMAELEEEGYITQPHTSAGRIPTSTGYRKYVDRIKADVHIERKRAEKLEKEYISRIRTIKNVIEKTSFLISRELHNAGIVMWPSVSDFYLRQIEFIKVRAETILAILVTMTNDVRNYMIKLDKDLESAELRKIANFINTNYEGQAFSQAFTGIKNLVEKRSADSEEITGIADSVLEIIDSIMDETIENDVYWDGFNFFAEEPEFQNINTTRKVIQLFSNREYLTALMKKELPKKDLNIYIGKENLSDMLEDCSVVTCGYNMRGRTVGRIGVVGPTRMDYGLAISTVQFLSEVVGTKLDEI